jgi:hypothetical protein
MSFGEFGVDILKRPEKKKLLLQFGSYLRVLGEGWGSG